MIENNTHKIVLTNIIDASDADKKMVRNIRNEDGVRRWMYSDHIITENEHTNWLEKLKLDKKNLVYIIKINNDSPIGVVSINSIDMYHENAEWAFYLSSTARSGIGAVLEFNVIDFIFVNLKLKKLNCEVIETNESVLSLHSKFGFTKEGFRKSNINKDNTRIGVHLLGITIDDWLEIRDKLASKYEKLLSKYVIHWN